jgi:hypothetical protein
VSLTKRLGDAARSSLRAGRGLVGDSSGHGPEALYARILDGRHLWLAVPAELGRPLLWDERAHREVALDHLDGVEESEYASVRWLLEDALAEHDGAELLVAAATEDGDPVPLRPPSREPATRLRIPPTPDRRWRFVLPTSDDGLLRVRRNKAASVAILEQIATVGASVRVEISSDQDGPVRLIFIDKDGQVAHEVPMTREHDLLVVTLGEADLPEVAGGYGLWVGTPEHYQAVLRRHNDLHVSEGDDILLPLVLGGPEGDVVAGRFRFNAQGGLRIARRPSTGDAAAGADA